MPQKKSNKKRKQAFYVILGALGIILFWRGIWTVADYSPIIENPVVSIALGLILLVVSHQWYKEL